MKKRKKRSPVQIARDNAWRAFSDYIRQRDRGTCVTCNARVWDSEKGEVNWRAMNAGHFRHGKFDFDEKNISTQCVRCNKWLSGNLGAYALYLIKKYGEDAVRELQERDEVSDKRTKEEWDKLTEEYRARIAAKDWL